MNIAFTDCTVSNLGRMLMEKNLEKHMEDCKFGKIQGIRMPLKWIFNLEPGNTWKFKNYSFTLLCYICRQ